MDILLTILIVLIGGAVTVWWLYKSWSGKNCGCKNCPKSGQDCDQKDQCSR